MMTRSDDAFRFLSTMIEKEGGFGKVRAAAIASQFSTLKSFKDADFTRPLSRADGTRIGLTKKNVLDLGRIQESVMPSATLNEHWVRLTVRRRGLAMIEHLQEIKLEKITMNPFLIKMLKLKTPEAVVKFNVYQSVTRSIVTSMGTALEQMVASSSGTRLGNRKEWYDVIKTKGKKSYWIQVKSGPNNINVDQVKSFNEKFNETEKKKDNHARIGITYGKRGMNTVSLGLVKKYMDDWERRLLVGRELWDFASDEKNYHTKVLRWIDDEMSEIHNKSMDGEINMVIRRILADFKKRYGKGSAAVQRYVDESL